MDLEMLLAFAQEAENKLLAIRGGISLPSGRTDGGTCKHNSAAWAIKEAAASLGLDEAATVFETLHQESSRIFASRMPLSDEGSRILLDLLAHAEAEILKVRLAIDDNPINIADFVDQSFDFLRFDVPSEADVQIATEPEPAAPEEAEDEFEIDAEMLEIFAMEAEDLLGNIETNLDALIADPSNHAALWEIRRNAHPFKGVRRDS